MKAIASRSLSFVAAVLMLLTFAGPARAGLVVTLAAAPGTDLSNVHVGDSLQFITFGSSDLNVDEFLLAFPDVHLFSSGTADFDLFSGVQLAGWNNLLSTTPPLALWTIRASTAGTVDLFNGFSDCVGLPGDTFGCAMTSVGDATRPADSNHITFNVLEVPEPSSIALLAVALLALGYSRRKA